MAANSPPKLPPGALSGVSGDDYRPLVGPEETQSEFTPRAILLGALFGIVFGAANAYLGLKVGITVSTSSPIAVMTVLVLGWIGRGKASLLESNMAQTVGSASSSLASGVIFTIPALFLWGLSPTLLELTLLALCGGLLGTLAMIPLRRPLIRKEHGNLPYPEGTACAEILVASKSGGDQGRTVVAGGLIGGIYKVATDIFHLWPVDFHVRVPRLPKGVFAIEAAPMFLGVGYILGYNVSAIMVAGSLLSALVFIPLIAHFGQYIPTPMFPEVDLPISEMSPSKIWSQYIRYVGAGAVAAGGIITIVQTFPTMIRAFKASVKELADRAGAQSKERTDQDIPFKYVIIGVCVIIALIALVPTILSHVDSVGMRLLAAVCIAFFAFFFVTVSSRIVGYVGVSSNPTSGMTIATLIGTSGVFYALGWTDTAGKVTALTVGTIVCTAASIAGDMSQDLKTGFLLGATPKRQQRGEMIGVITAAVAVCGSVILLNSQYGFGTKDLPAPQATLMKTVIEGILSANIPWTLVFIGALTAVIVELIGIKALPFAVGIYLPLSSMSPIFIGGCLRWWLERRHRENSERLNHVRERGVLFGSGLVAGQGIAAVLIAGLAFGLGRKPEWGGYGWMGGAAQWVALALFLGLWLYMKREAERPSRDDA
jgi:putative OPT family oligopeptide transporter